MTLIYIASPYTHEDKKIVSGRYYKTVELVSQLVKSNPHNFYYSPIVHFHKVAEYGQLPTHAHYWKTYNEAFIRALDELLVYRLNGWDKSIGVQAEIKYAEELNKPINYID